MASWKLIFENSGSHNIKCINEKVYLAGELAYVICNEVFPQGQLVATNIFVIENRMWRMVHHQASPCVDSGQINESYTNKSLQVSSTSLH